MKYGRLAIIAPAESVRTKSGQIKRRVVCECECGAIIIVRYQSLVRGNTTSCGCWKRENMKNGLRLTHGASRRKLKTAEYAIWAGMRKRCLHKNDINFFRYGGRGIHICKEWRNSFEAFLADMGPRPTRRHTIERIDNDGPYSPQNCRWATYKDQANNRSSNKRLTFNGMTFTLAQWSERTGIPGRVLSQRSGELGWSAERALTEAVQMGRRRK